MVLEQVPSQQLLTRKRFVSDRLWMISTGAASEPLEWHTYKHYRENELSSTKKNYFKQCYMKRVQTMSIHETYAAVFPDPVLARASISFPSKARGIAFS